MNQNFVAKTKEEKNKKYMLVSYSNMNLLGFFEHNETNIPRLFTRVVVKTDKGLELGQIVGSFAYRAGNFKLSRDQVTQYFQTSDIEFDPRPVGKVIRQATAADLSEERHLKASAAEEALCCRRFVEEMNLPMKIVDAEHIFGGERIIFYFMADGRVDFRELVKKLGQEYQTRIEMRQIGSRDEALLFADCEICGQQCCCQRYLKTLKPVNMRMAKTQKATLDPAKISGYCGRLKCCLRYEDQTYTELKNLLPQKGTIVKTSSGKGRVIDTQILTQMVVVEHDEGTKVAVSVDEIEIIGPAQTKQQQNDAVDNNNNINLDHENKPQMDNH